MSARSRRCFIAFAAATTIRCGSSEIVIHSTSVVCTSQEETIRLSSVPSIDEQMRDVVVVAKNNVVPK